MESARLRKIRMEMCSMQALMIKVKMFKEGRLMMTLDKKVFIFVCMMIMALTNLSGAVVVDLGDSGWAMVVSPLVLEHSDVSVPWYGIEGDTLYLELHKTFGRPLDDSEMFLPIVLEFEKISENASSTIVLTDEYIVNDSDVEWYDFHMQLMVSISEPEAGFDPQYVFDGQQLENVFYSEFVGYDGLPVKLNFLNEEGGGVPPVPPGEDIFWPGYEQGELVIVTNPEMEVGDRFALKEMPSVPEPATLALLGGGAFCVYTRKRKKK